MRIAYVIINANRREGTSRAVLEVAERIAQDHEVHLWARRAEDFDECQIQLRRVGGAGWPAVIDLSSFASAADRGLRNAGYDLIHSAGVNTTLADVYTVQTVQVEKRRAMINVDAHRDASLARRFTRQWYDRRVIRGERACYTESGPRGPRAFAPVAQTTQQELLGNYPVGKALMDVIPNAADLELFSPTKRPSARRRITDRHNLSDDDFLLVFSGGEWRRKGLDLAIRSLRHIADERVKLIIAGTDPVGRELEMLADQLGVGQRVVFAGFRPDIENYYAAGDLFLFPTAYEAFSLATIEAAASGLPVLMPMVSGATELVGTGEAGVLIDRDPRLIAETICGLVSQPRRLDQLRRGARSIVERRYSWDIVASRTMALYEALLRKRSET